MAEKTTITTLAKELGVSATTVHKALSGKGKISENTRRRVLDAAQAHHYVPNRAARALARGPQRVAVVLPEKPLEFQEAINAGIAQAFEVWRDYQVYPVFFPFDFWREESVTTVVCQVCAQAKAGKLQGILLQATPTPPWTPLMDCGLPLVTLISSSGKGALASVRTNAGVMGRMAGELLSLLLPPDAPCAVLTPNEDQSIYQEALSGFREGLTTRFVGCYETGMADAGVFQAMERLFQEHPRTRGVYVTSYYAPLVCDWLKAAGRVEEVRVVGQDLYPRIVACLQDGSLCATLFQDQRQQGRMAAERLAAYLSGATDRVESTLLTPTLVLRSNLACYCSV